VAAVSTFLFDAPKKATLDTITDCVPGEDVVALDASEFHVGAAATEASHRIIGDPLTGFLSFDESASTAGGSSRSAKLAAGLDLTNDGFAMMA